MLSDNKTGVEIEKDPSVLLYDTEYFDLLDLDLMHQLQLRLEKMAATFAESCWMHQVQKTQN